MLIEVRRCCLRAVSTWRARALILGNGRSRPEGPGLYTFRTFGRKRARYRRDHSRGDLHPELENSPARRIPYPRRDGDATIEDTDSLAHDRSRKLNSSRRAEERRWGGGGEEGEREGGGNQGRAEGREDPRESALNPAAQINWPSPSETRERLFIFVTFAKLRDTRRQSRPRRYHREAGYMRRGGGGGGGGGGGVGGSGGRMDAAGPHYDRAGKRSGETGVPFKCVVNIRRRVNVRDNSMPGAAQGGTQGRDVWE